MPFNVFLIMEVAFLFISMTVIVIVSTISVFRKLETLPLFARVLFDNSFFKIVDTCSSSLILVLQGNLTMQTRASFQFMVLKNIW